MQYKKVGSKIQILAYRGYDKDKKRAVVKMLGSIDAYTYIPTKDLMENLSTDEKTELQSYIDNARLLDKNRDLQFAVDYLHTRIEKATTALGSGFTIKEPQKLFDSMDALKKAMKKAGYKPIKKEKVIPPVKEG